MPLIADLLERPATLTRVSGHTVMNGAVHTVLRLLLVLWLALGAWVLLDRSAATPG